MVNKTRSYNLKATAFQKIMSPHNRSSILLFFSKILIANDMEKVGYYTVQLLIEKGIVSIKTITCTRNLILFSTLVESA